MRLDSYKNYSYGSSEAKKPQKFQGSSLAEGVTGSPASPLRSERDRNMVKEEVQEVLQR